MSEQGIHLIGNLYWMLYLGAFFFFVAWEGNGSQNQVVRVGRNLVLFALVIFLADVVVGDWLMGGGNLLLHMPAGLVAGPNDSIATYLVIGLLATDLFDYGFHRLAHRLRWLWLFHAVHHSDPTVDASTALRAHPVETALNVAGMMALLTLLGIPLWVEGIRSLLLNSLTIAHHANVRYPRWFEYGLRWLIITPGVHRLHHSTEASENNRNFGSTLSVWDRLFGTYSAPEPSHPKRCGLTALDDPSWQSLKGMLLTPWRARKIRVF
jgi:sterol desaturase/sphingolipid hydroxylase (fatty acid hydroxylase superfamily)